MNKKIYIPTMGREHRQRTLANISPEWHKHTVLVCPSTEKHELPEGVTRVDVPEECVGNIGKTRQWIMESSDADYIICCDDDLQFHKFDFIDDESQEITTKPNERYRGPEAGDFIFDKIFGELETTGLPYVTILGSSYMLHEKKDEWIDYGCGYRIHGFNRKLFLSLGIRYDVVRFSEDSHTSISLLEMGYPIRTYQRAYTSESNTADDNGNMGGCIALRTKENIEENMLILRDLHPKYVKLVYREGHKNQKIETGVKTIVSWKKAWDENKHKHSTGILDDIFF